MVLRTMAIKVQPPPSTTLKGTITTAGTAVTLQKIIRDTSGTEVEITSFREGDVVGMHEVVLESHNDTIYLCHDSKSRRGFAEGAVRAAEWLAGKNGFFDFKDIWRET